MARRTITLEVETIDEATIMECRGNGDVLLTLNDDGGWTIGHSDGHRVIDDCRDTPTKTPILLRLPDPKDVIGG